MNKLYKLIIPLLLGIIVALPAPAYSSVSEHDELDYIGAYGTGPWLSFDTTGVSIILNGPRDEKKVALGFDDGPFQATNDILDILGAYGVKATFFMVGWQVEKFPDIAKRVADEGNEIGNHSYSHKMLTKVDRATMIYQVDHATEVIYQATNVYPTVFRPPYRAYNDELLEYVNDAGMTLALWDVDPKDWDTSSPSLVQDRVLSHVKPGSILTMHDLSAGTRGSLATIIESLRDKGYEFVTVGELIEDLARVRADEETTTEAAK